MSSQTPDTVTSWASPFLRTLLDRWLSAVANEVERKHTPGGLFFPYLDRQWRRTGGGPLTLVSQCRLVYNFSRGFQVFDDPRFADAAARGLAALETHFRLPQGGYRWAVTAGGDEYDPTPDAYGHAFVVLAQATAAQAFDDPALARRALDTWRHMAATFTDRRGGLLWHVRGPNSWETSPRSQNPVMHTFEALMALDAVDGTGEARDGARRLLGFLRGLTDFGAGRLIERYTPDWQPLPVDQGGVIDLGHAFEWAWLLSEWSVIGADPSALELGAAFLQTGVEWGMDADGGVRASCDPLGNVVNSGRGLWPQCEAVRALRRYAVAYGRTDLDDPLRRALAFYREQFVDDEWGGVYAAPPMDTSKGNPWKLDYHTVGMCLELLREAPPSDPLSPQG